jgi:CRP-like cAMP-binding protein
MVESAILADLDVFKGLSEEELQAVGDIMTETEVPAKNNVFSEDDHGDSLYVVIEGEVGLSHQIAEDIHRELISIGPGSVFGEMALVDPGGRTATAVIKSDAKLLVLVRNSFFELALKNHALGAKVFLNLSLILTDRLRQANESHRVAMLWGMQVSGATHLNFHQFMADEVRVDVQLITGADLAGLILRVEQTRSGHELTMMDDDGNIQIVPYHAISTIKVKTGS